MQSNKAYLSGTLSTIILALLKGNGKMYGYEICQMTKQKTSDDIQLTEGAIYPALHKLEKAGLIKSTKERVNGRIRKYYLIEESAFDQVSEQIRNLFDFTNHVQTILKPAIK